MNLEDRLYEVVTEAYQASYPSKDGAAAEATKQLIRDVLAEVTPAQFHTRADRPNLNDEPFMLGFNAAVNEIEAKAKELGL